MNIRKHFNNRTLGRLVGFNFFKKIKIFENRNAAFLSLSLLVGFYCVYVLLGLLILPNPHKFDFFGADSQSKPWTLIEGPHYHKGSHPLLLLFVIPFGSFLSFLTSSRTVAVVLLNSFFGASAVLLSSIFFLKLTKKYIETLLLSLVFGLSMSQLVFGSIPETYELSACSIITTYLLFIRCLQAQEIYFPYWIPAGLFSFGVTITNFFQTLICFIVAVWFLKKKINLFYILKYLGIVVSLAVLLSLVQKLLFSDANYFFMPSLVSNESNYFKVFLLDQPLLVAQEILKHFFLVNFVSPSPFALNNIQTSNPLVLGFFNRPINYSFIGVIGAILWLGLFFAGFSKNLIFAIKNPLFIAPASGVVFNMVLHSIYGVNEMFLYTCNFTFLVLLLVVNQSMLKKKAFKLGLGLLIVLMGLNNLMVIEQIILNNP